MIDVARFIGTPFVRNGRGPEGYDCWGLAMAVFAACGIAIPDYRIDCFATAAVDGQVRRSAGAEWLRLPQPEAPCLVVMRTSEERPDLCTHVGTYLGDGVMIHTMRKLHASLGRVDGLYWRHQIAGFYQYVGGDRG